MNPDEFVKRLDAISEHDGTPYGRVHAVFDAETTHAKAVLQYRGYLSLSDAFKCFFLETVELVNVECRPKIAAPLSEFYPLFVPRLAHSFLSLCGAERIAICGYPYHGYTLLRNVFDNLLLTSAALQRITDFYSIEGVVPNTTFDPGAVKRRRKSTEYAVRRQMVGEQSNLTPQTLGELAKWDALFDFETHGARLSMTQAMEWMKGKAPLPILPRFDELAFAMFMNRYCEVAWMTHRLIPCLSG